MKKLLLILAFVTMACGSTIPLKAELKSSEPISKATKTATATKEKPQFMCMTDKLIYVRAKAGTNYKPVATLDFYTLTGRESNTRDRAVWYQVQTHKGIIGWVNARLIREYCGIRY
jgi:uncharacterized protein YgiM (DUF1202 family)